MQTINVMKWTAMWLPLACDTSVLLVHAGNCWLKISITWVSGFMSTNCMNISRDGLHTLQMPSARNLMECKRLMPDPDVFQALLSISVDRQAKVMATLQKISKEVIISIYHHQTPAERLHQVHGRRAPLWVWCDGSRASAENETLQVDKPGWWTGTQSQRLGFQHFQVTLCFSSSPQYHADDEAEQTNLHVVQQQGWRGAKMPAQSQNLSAEKAPLLRQKHVLEEKDRVARRLIVLVQNRQKKEAVQFFFKATRSTKSLP